MKNKVDFLIVRCYDNDIRKGDKKRLIYKKDCLMSMKHAYK